MIKVQTITAGLFEENCYLIYDDNSLLVVDPGGKYRKIAEAIDLLDKKVEAILLTHGHFDHTGAVDSLYKKYHCPIFAEKGDEVLLRNKLNGSVVESEINWLDTDELNISNLVVKVYYVPGHSQGSVMYQVEDKLFSGDTLFRLSVGRTDLYGGSHHKLMQSLQVFNTMDPNITIYPGHEAASTVGFELDNNPYLK